KRPAADAGEAEVARLLGEEIDDLERVVEDDALLPQRLGDLEPGEHAERAVEAPARRHRVGMRTENDRPARRLAARQMPDEIAAGIARDREPRGRELLLQPGPALEEPWREGP